MFGAKIARGRILASGMVSDDAGLHAYDFGSSGGIRGNASARLYSMRALGHVPPSGLALCVMMRGGVGNPMRGC